MMEPQTQSPLVLVASEGEWVGRSLENVLEANGYTVLRVESGRRALELTRRTHPDAVFLDDSLSDISGVGICRALRDDPLFNHATPIFVTASAQHANRVRAEAYEAGAWDYCTLPVDVETLLAKIGTFIRASREASGVRAKSLVDRSTGLYSQYGLQQWADQLGARALRKSEPIGCVVITADVAMSDGGAVTDEQSSDVLAAVTDVCRATSRRSDVVGYLGDLRFAIIAPDTDASGIQRLIDRLQQAVDGGGGYTARSGRRTASLRAGYCAVSNLAAANFNPSDLIRRAQTALDFAPPRGRFDSAAVNFDELLQS